MKKHGKLLLKYLLLFVMTVFVMGCFSVSAATKTGFVTQKGKTYYINKDGSKQKGWLELKGKKYYFDKKTGVQVKGWVKDSSGQAIRYFTSGAGYMVTGFITDSNGYSQNYIKSLPFPTSPPGGYISHLNSFLHKQSPS